VMGAPAHSFVSRSPVRIRVQGQHDGASLVDKHAAQPGAVAPLRGAL
jgi:hypothetical protein